MATCLNHRVITNSADEASLNECKRLYGEYHYDILALYSELGEQYRFISEYKKAVYYKELALNNSEHLYGDNHAYTAFKLQSLADMYVISADYEKADLFYRRALKIREKLLSPNDPLIADTLRSIGILYTITSQYSKAEDTFRRVNSIITDLLGPDHRLTTICMNDLALLYLSIGNYIDAEIMLQKILKTNNQWQQEKDIFRNNLALLYVKNKKYVEAEKEFKKINTIMKTSNNMQNNDINTIKIRNNYSEYLIQTGHLLAAEALLNNNIKAINSSLKNSHPEFAVGLIKLARILIVNGQLDKASRYLNRALFIAIISKSQSIEKDALLAYSMLAEKSNNVHASIFFAKIAININQSMRKEVSVLGKDKLWNFDKTIEEHYTRLANLLIGQGRLAESQQILAIFKEEELFEFIRRDARSSGVLSTQASFISMELPWETEYLKFKNVRKYKSGDMFEVDNILNKIISEINKESFVF